MSTKILIVEDEFIVANSLRLVLGKAGYLVTGIATSGAEAYESLQRDKPDLVLLDIRLNGRESGIDLAIKLKSEHIAFVYLSANSSQKVLEEAKKTEPYGFLVKPFRERDLLVALDIAIYLHQNRLETKLKQEANLQKQLLEIGNETSAFHHKLLKIGGALRAFIPFDLIVYSTRPFNESAVNDCGYLRIGFDEYQFIAQPELQTISGLNEQVLATIIKASDVDSDIGFYNSASGGDQTGSPLRQVWRSSFKMESCMVFPVALDNGAIVEYSFFSRRRDSYAQNHIGFLNVFSSCLASVARKMAASGMPSVPTILNPVEKRPKVLAQADNGFENIIGKHPLLLAALDLVTQVSPYNTSVLILGESGTGKESIAEAIHAHSIRRNGPLIKVNCAAIPPSLMESELFGHEKGAFTGAVEKRKGKFEQAHEGTIFLDEIGEMPLDLQVRLLRVLQEKEIDPLGARLTRKVDVRIVAATNRNLEQEVAEGRFRLDLYYRLNVFPVTLPPLRERKSDIAALAFHFANRFCRDFDKNFHGIAESMIEELQAYSWPGNIRELENVLERSVILNDGNSELVLKQSLIGSAVGMSGKAGIETFGDVRRVQKETERDYLISVLRKTNGLIRGVNGAAELLNIKPTTLESKMARLGIQKEDL